MRALLNGNFGEDHITMISKIDSTRMILTKYGVFELKNMRPTSIINITR